MESGSKKYGLLVPKKKLGGVKASNVFGNDSDSENESKNKPIQTSNQTKAQQRSAKLIHEMALEEDATVFQYDEVYDEMEKKKENLDEKKKQVDKKPRYIQSLLVQAEKRKIEYERRNERLIQKERETEGNEFSDKEAFVTSSYKKKLEELKKMDEEDLKLSLIEDINDVTKQRNMGSFYRHLFKSELCKNENDNKNDDDNDQKKTKKSDANRQYRKRASSNSSDDKDKDNDDKDTDISDSDSDSSVDSSKRKKSESCSEKDVKGEIAEKPKGKLEEKTGVEESKVKQEEEVSNDKPELREENTKDISEDKKIKKNESKPKEIIPKINIWEKRTIGDVYEAARQRYFERKMKQINLHAQS